MLIAREDLNTSYGLYEIEEESIEAIMAKAKALIFRKVLAAMSSSRSDTVTPLVYLSVRSCVSSSVRPFVTLFFLSYSMNKRMLD